MLSIFTTSIHMQFKTAFCLYKENYFERGFFHKKWSPQGNDNYTWFAHSFSTFLVPISLEIDPSLNQMLRDTLVK